MKKQIFENIKFIDSEEISVITGGCSSSSSSGHNSCPTPMTPSGPGMGPYYPSTPSTPGILSGACGGF